MTPKRPRDPNQLANKVGARTGARTPLSLSLQTPRVGTGPFPFNYPVKGPV
jgi:hypothetical protein